MNTKYLTIGIIALIVVGLGIFLYQSTTKSTLPKPEPAGAMSPYVEFEATIISLSLENPDGYTEGNEIYRAPEDSAVVRIDKIIETGGSSNFDWSSIGIEEGKEVSLDFKYSVRPTKIITVVGETTQSGNTTSHTIVPTEITFVPTEITFENNYFVFKENGNSETETILPGLEEGSKFETKLWKTFEVKVGKYEIISCFFAPRLTFSPSARTSLHSHSTSFRSGHITGINRKPRCTSLSQIFCYAKNFP